MTNSFSQVVRQGRPVDIAVVLIGSAFLVLFVFWLLSMAPSAFPPYLQQAISSVWGGLVAGPVGLAFARELIKQQLTSTYIVMILVSTIFLSAAMGLAAASLPLRDLWDLRPADQIRSAYHGTKTAVVNRSAITAKFGVFSQFAEQTLIRKLYAGEDL